MASENEVLRILLVIVAVIVLVPILMMAFMMPMMGMWGWSHMADGGTWGNAGGTWTLLLMWFVMFAVVASIGYLIYRAVRRSADSVSDAALEELRVAYARGDLSDDEFEERRERLRRDR
jgi:putative membrane protein